MAHDDKSKNKSKTELTAHHGSSALPQPLPLNPHSANVPENDNQPRPPRPSPLLSHIRSGARKRGCCRTVFLIANTRLKVLPSHSKLSSLRFSNRERMAISLRFTKPPTTAKHQFQRPTTHSLSANQPPFRRVTSLKFLIVTKRTFITRPAARDSLRSLHSPNFNLRQRNELRFKWHRHSCLCSDDHRSTTSTHHRRPHFTSASTQPDPRLQSNSRKQAEAA
jgi:hypothetical protein